MWNFSLKNVINFTPGVSSPTSRIKYWNFQHLWSTNPEIMTPALEDIPATTNVPGHAYVTFLAGDGDYVKGVVALAKGLRKVKAAYPLVVAVLADVPAEHRCLLVNQGCILRQIEEVHPPVSDKEGPYIRSYFALNYCKLRLWEVRFCNPILLQHLE